MNNDMVNNNKPHINTQNINGATCAISKAMQEKSEKMCDAESMDKAMEFLGSMGQTLIQRNDNKTFESVKKATQIFVDDSLYVESYINFCDGLIEKGHNMDSAIKKTDEVFETLKDGNLYS